MSGWEEGGWMGRRREGGWVEGGRVSGWVSGRVDG